MGWCLFFVLAIWFTMFSSFAFADVLFLIKKISICVAFFPLAITFRSVLAISLLVYKIFTRWTNTSSKLIIIINIFDVSLLSSSDKIFSRSWCLFLQWNSSFLLVLWKLSILMKDSSLGPSLFLWQFHWRFWFVFAISLSW